MFFEMTGYFNKRIETESKDVLVYLNKPKCLNFKKTNWIRNLPRLLYLHQNVFLKEANISKSSDIRNLNIEAVKICINVKSTWCFLMVLCCGLQLIKLFSCFGVLLCFLEFVSNSSCFFSSSLIDISMDWTLPHNWHFGPWCHALFTTLFFVMVFVMVDYFSQAWDIESCVFC